MYYNDSIQCKYYNYFNHVVCWSDIQVARSSSRIYNTPHFLIVERRGSDSSRPSSRRRRRKSMKRRSSGGPDVLLSTGQSMDSFLAHRRGSLPVEILATSFSGEVTSNDEYNAWCNTIAPVLPLCLQKRNTITLHEI